MAILKIGKLDAARRQLETAVRLYFAESDPVSIHTLTAAAHVVLTDLNKLHTGKTKMLTDLMLSHVREEKRQEVKRLLNEAANFFKHADRDSLAVHDFDPAQTEIFLVDACYKFRELTGEVVQVLGVYCTWYMLAHPAQFILSADQTGAISKARATFAGASKQAFFAEMLPIASTLNL